MTRDFDPLDDLLAHDAARTDIVPSSGFAESVMDAVRRSKAAPPPIPFPWRRVWPWLIAAVILMAIGTTGLVRLPGPSSDLTFEMPAMVRDALGAVTAPDSLSVVGGLLLALASAILALRSGQLFQRR
jgi:hypothetical protein